MIKYINKIPKKLFISIKRRKKGFTLMETVLYLGLFSTFFVILIQFALNVGENNQKADIKNELAKLSIYTTEHLANNFQNTITVDDTNSLFKDDNGQLVLNLEGNSVTYSINEDRLFFNNNGQTSYLTSSNFLITSFYLEKIEQNGNIIGVRVTLEIEVEEFSHINSSLTTLYVIN